MFVFVLSLQRNCVERTSTVGRRHTRSKTCNPTPPTRFNFAPTSAMEPERHKRTPLPSKVPQDNSNVTMFSYIHCILYSCGFTVGGGGVSGSVLIGVLVAVGLVVLVAAVVVGVL